MFLSAFPVFLLSVFYLVFWKISLIFISTFLLNFYSCYDMFNFKRFYFIFFFKGSLSSFKIVSCSYFPWQYFFLFLRILMVTFLLKSIVLFSCKVCFLQFAFFCFKFWFLSFILEMSLGCLVILGCFHFLRKEELKRGLQALKGVC